MLPVNHHTPMLAQDYGSYDKLLLLAYGRACGVSGSPIGAKSRRFLF
jgi:hypothetical protein